MKMTYLLNWLTCLWYLTATRSTSDWPDWPRVCRCSLWLSREESSRGVDEEGWHSYPSEQLKQGSLTLYSFYCLLLNCSVTAFVIHIWITRQCFDTVGWVAGRASSLLKNQVVRYWCDCLSGAMCIWFAYGPADAAASLSLTPVKSRMVLSWKKGH